MSSLRIGDIKAMAQKAHRDKECRDGLFEAMLSGKGKEASNAAWALTHLPDEDNQYIDEHRDELVRLATSTSEVPVRRLSMTLLERLEWGIDDVRTDLLDFCLERMVMNEEPYGVRSLCIKLAYMMCRHYPELKAELRQSLLLMERTEMGSGVRHTHGKVLRLLA